MSGLLALKYLSWAISVLLPFVGAWFFKFTEDVPGSDRRRLTRSGRTAVVVATAGLLMALALTVATDVQAKNDEAARNVAEQQRAYAEDERDKALSRLERGTDELKEKTEKINQLASLIAENIESLPDSERRKFVDVLGPETYAALLPDDYENVLFEDLSIGDLSRSREQVAAVQCNLARQRFHQTPACVALFPEETPPICWRVKSWTLENGIRVSLGARSDESSIEVGHVGTIENEPDWSKNVRFAFTDGWEQAYACSPSIYRCDIHFNDHGQGTALYDQLKSVRLESIEVPMPEGLLGVPVSEATAGEILQAANCLFP